MGQRGDSADTPGQDGVARWLRRCGREMATHHQPLGPIDLAEQVVRKLSPRVAALVTAAGYRALLSRALHLTRDQFPVLDGVQIGTSGAYINGPRTAGGGAIDEGLVALIGTLIALLATFVGDDLTDNLIRDAWPDAPRRRVALGSGGTRGPFSRLPEWQSSSPRPACRAQMMYWVVD